jgi:molybdenum cofactor synthesis domain-containing protein
VAGEMVLPEGVEITPWAQGAMLAGGVTQVLVRRRPKVIIIPTGSELMPVTVLGPEPPPNYLVEFNSVILSGLVEETGGLPEVWPITPDDPAALTEVLGQAVKAGDVILINAGSSAGSEDYTYQAVAALGEVLVHGVAMMPGKPTLLGVVAGKPVIGNPGYPVSAVLSFEEFAAPLLAGMVGRNLVPRPILTVHPSQNLPSKPGLTEFIRVTLGRVGDKVMATPLPRGAGTITSLVRADGLLKIPALSEGLEEDPWWYWGAMTTPWTFWPPCSAAGTPGCACPRGTWAAWAASWRCARAGPTWGAPTSTTRRPTPTTSLLSRSTWRACP